MTPAAPKWIACACFAMGAFIIAFSLAQTDTPLARPYRRYTQHLERYIKLTFSQGSGRRIAALQLGAALGVTALLACLKAPATYYAAIAAVALGPTLYWKRRHRHHVKRVEGQVDALIVALANALKTVPSPAAALGQLVAILPVPMRFEVERLLKEMRVGSTLEQAILNMSARLQSRDLDSALSAVLIGLQVGGNLPAVLEGTAATIREMNRLEGVVRTKTSEARAQLWVLALFPFVISAGFHAIDADYFVPLQTTTLGSVATAVACLFWIMSLVTARKILQVDI
jgi:tight adherence protein B